MNISTLSTERHRKSPPEDTALDLYLGRIQQNLTALFEQCAQLQTVVANKQGDLREIQEVQEYLGIDSPTIAELLDLLRKHS
jgi:hypothetical protein